MESLREEVVQDRYRYEVEKARGGSKYLFEAVQAEVSQMSDDEINRYAQEAGITTLNQCVTDNFRHDLFEDADYCHVCGMGPYSPEEVRLYNSGKNID